MSGRTQRTEETRAELIRAAAVVFVEHGFHSASLQRIARRAGFTTGAIYSHFGGKDDLFLAVFEEYARTRVGELDEITSDPDVSPAGRAQAMADQWMRRHAEEPEFVVVALEFAVHALRTPKLREALATRHAAVRLAASRTLARDAAEADLDLPMPALDLATALRELGVGLALAQLIDPDGIRESLYGDFVAAFYERALAPSASETAKRGA